MEYGLIFHGMRTGKYYCKNIKYRINILYIRTPTQLHYPARLRARVITYKCSESGVDSGLNNRELQDLVLTFTTQIHESN